MEKNKCKLCEKEFDTQKSFSEHAKKIHNIKIIKTKNKISVRSLK